MNKIVLTAIPILLAILACSDIVPLGPDTSAKCSYVQKEHIGLYSNLNVNCNLNKPCRASVSFAGVFWSDSITTRQDFCISTTKFEYLYKKGDYEIKVHMNTHVDMSLDSDDHVRFSLFDSKNVEKTYDIDLSEMVRSYFVKEDSLYIKIPENMSYLAIGIKRPDGYQNVEIMDSVIENGYFVHVANESLRSYFYMDQEFSNQSSFGTDSIHVFATLYWRE